MQVIDPEDLIEWLRLDPDTDQSTLAMLVSSALDVIEHECGLRLRPYTDLVTSTLVTPIVPESLKHAVAVFVSAHFDDRAGDNAMALKTVRALCAPFRVARL